MIVRRKSPWSSSTISVFLNAQAVSTLPFTLDAWAQVESGRLRFHESNQDNYRREVWQGVADSAEQGLDTYEIGTRIILPSSFINGPRSFYALYQDAMAIIKLCGQPDIS